MFLPTSCVLCSFTSPVAAVASATPCLSAPANRGDTQLQAHQQLCALLQLNAETRSPTANLSSPCLQLKDCIFPSGSTLPPSRSLSCISSSRIMATAKESI
uniref:Secreted protein n=1 Tax=Micrurus carvalhoi TaxID=3147026 RepID=A0A2H6NFF7_9SAUR